MSTNSQTHGLAQEFAEAIHEVRDTLQRAADATRTLDALTPRLDAITATFDELEAVIRRGREQISAPAAAKAAAVPAIEAVVPAALPRILAAQPLRPTLIVPGPRVPQWGPPRTSISAPSSGRQQPTSALEPASGAVTLPRTATTSFRLAFESTPGPLDLRAVDDAVSKHPSVRDVALLDYDGHRATLKVWIAEPARPADVQQNLMANAPEIFAGNNVNIIALEDAA